MFGLRTADQIERTRTFDVIVEKTGEALSDPETIEKLGVLGVDLAQMNAEAFLPNVKKGKVTLPREYKESDGVAIVPILHGEEGKELELSLDMFGPTPQRQRKMEQYAQEHPNPLISPDDFIALSQANIFKAERRYAPQLWRNSPLLTLVTHTKSRKEDTPYLSSRPIIFVGTTAPMTHLPGLVSHEYVHAHDDETLDRPPQDLRHYQVYRELRGYFTQFIMFKTADLPMTEHTADVHVERLRRSFGMPLPPQHPDESIPAELVDIVHACTVG